MDNIPEAGGYKVIKLQLSPHSKSVHCIYVKEHKVREKTLEKPEGRTVFALGVPPYADEESLKRAFSVFDKVAAVYIHSNPCSSVPPVNTSSIFIDHPPIKGFKVAYIVFETEGGVKNTLSLDPSACLTLSTDERPLTLGLDAWCEKYNSDIITDTDKMQKEIEEYMKVYDSKMEEETVEMKESSAVPDEEGWVTVTKKLKNKTFPRKESYIRKIKEKEEQKKAKKMLQNFYRFQIRESKMNSIVDLRKRYADDKRKIALLKNTKRFKPF